MGEFARGQPTRTGISRWFGKSRRGVIPQPLTTNQQRGFLAAWGGWPKLPDTYFEEFVPRVHAVEVADVIRVAERYVDPARAVTLVVGDYQAVAESLRPLGLGEPQLLPSDV